MNHRVSEMGLCDGSSPNVHGHRNLLRACNAVLRGTNLIIAGSIRRESRLNLHLGKGLDLPGLCVGNGISNDVSSGLGDVGFVIGDLCDNWKLLDG